MSGEFVHLRLHTEYSLVDGIVRIKPLISSVTKAGMGAVAITDQSNLFGMVKFYKAASLGGIKPLVGIDAWLHNPDDANRPHRFTLLAQDQNGYRNLTRLVSRGYTEGQHLGIPQLQRSWLESSSQGLIAISGGREGDVGQALLGTRSDLVDRWVDWWGRIFPNRYYLELTRCGREGEEECLHASVDLAIAKGLPVVATNDVRFLRPEDFEAHEARVCIHDGRTLDDPRRPKRYSAQQYLRSSDEMVELFSDLPEALENSVEIARRCSLELDLGRTFLPAFPVPAGMTIEEFFVSEAKKGLDRRLASTGELTTQERATYDERLEIELGVIVRMGFPGYFLIVADFIRWAKDNGIPVGPGRGSGAGSLVAYALEITDLDPIVHELLFERFLNPERVSMPDFDVDFCMEGRDRVIDYVAERYGRLSVSQIITFGSMAAKAVVRDIGRVLGHPYGFVDGIAKLVPFEIGMTLDKALQDSEELRQRYESEEEVGALIDLARALEGISRNVGKHAGGVVIAPTLLTDYAPLYCEAGGANLVTQFDKDDVEAIGLVKFDFLGLRTLTIIDWALGAVNRERSRRGETPIDIAAIPVDDEAAFHLLKSCQTTAVFQLESRGMKELIKKLQPDCFDDITALVALYRPGPLQSGMVDDFINRKHGRAEVVYPHPKLEPILKSTYGVILYQEQVMQIAQVLAGYTLGGADLLRRAMGKKKPEEMEKQRGIFTAGSMERGVESETATYIFDLMEKFAGYGFNKSHSAAYALVSYQTMWLKAHYPAAFMAAVLSSDMDNTDKVVTFIDECRSMALKVEPPDVNRSDYRFTADGDSSVVYGLGAIKGVGQAAIEGILDARAHGGAFSDLFDFCRRIDLRKANRRVIEALIRSGALDRIGRNRATLMAHLPLALRLAEQQEAMAAAGQNDLFGMDSSGSAAPEMGVVPEDEPDWEDEARLQGEKETLGLYLTGHPVDRYNEELGQLVTARIADLGEEVADAQERRFGGGRGGRQQSSVTVAGLIVSMRQSRTARGRMASIVLDDRSGRIEVAVFNEVFARYKDRIVPDRIVVVTGVAGYDEFRGGVSLRAEHLYDLDEAREKFATALLLRVDGGSLSGAEQSRAMVDALQSMLSAFKGGSCTVRVSYSIRGARGALALADEWGVKPTEALLRGIERLLGPGSAKIAYSKAARPSAEIIPLRARTG